jgi:hypothetical protein
MICNIPNVSFRSFITMVITAYFIVSLGIASKNYRMASEIVKNTFDVLKKIPTGDTVIFRNLPRDNRGAIMLGLGLSEGHDWLIGSQKEHFLLIENITLEDRFFNASAISFEENVFPKDLTGKFLNPTSREKKEFQYNPGSTWLIAYDSSGIRLYKSY